MFNNGITFGSDGPMMDGTWYNPKTGDSFTVRNTFFEDNQYIVQTTDGRVLGYNQIQDYIKSDKPIQMEPKQQNTSLPQEVADLISDDYSDMIMEDDLNMIQGRTSLGNLANPVSTITPQPLPVTPSVSNNYDIIGKALTKRQLPDFQIGIDWKNCPISEMNMLMDLMDIGEGEIIDWYLSQVDVENTTIMIREVIKDYLYKMLYPEPVVKDKPIEGPKKPTPTKKSKKK